MRLNRVLVAAVLLSAVGACGEKVRVSEVWPVDGRIVSRDGKKARDLSGLACDRAAGFPRHCVVVDDEAQAAQVVTLYDGRLEAGAIIPLMSDAFDGRPLELDGEGVAFGGGDFYVIGSHGYPRDRRRNLEPERQAEEIAARIKASSRLLRFKALATRDANRDTIATGVVSSARVGEAIAASSVLSPYMNQRLDQNGLTVEGIAIIGDRIYVGFRAPLLESGKTAIMSLAVEALYGSGPLDAQVTLLDLDGHGVRDLSVRDGTLVILAGPSDAGDGSYAVYLWDRSLPPVFLGGLSDVASDEKPEAILPLDDPPGAMRFLILSDGVKEGSARAVAFKR
jgi:hypothetical protein